MLGDEHPDTLVSMSNLALAFSAQGDLAGARGLPEKVLDVRRRVQGNTHPATTVSAWNLLLTLLQTGQTEAARNVRQSLAWLMSSDEARLSADQRRIREKLAKQPPQAQGSER